MEITYNMNNPASTEYCTRYKGKNVVVLGASGFIGRWVARSLCLCGAHVYLVVRNRASANEIFTKYGVQGEIVEADLTNLDETFISLYKNIVPAITFNLAGYGIDRSERDETLAYKINSDLVEQLCQIISEYNDVHWSGLDLVHVGSALEYGEIGGDLNEESAPNPTTLYGQSKLAGTRHLSAFCKNGKLKGVTARLFTVYGPGEHPARLVPTLISAARNTERLQLTAGLQQRDFTYIKDVAEGLLRLGCCAGEAKGVVNLATGRLTTVRDFTESAAQVLEIAPDRLQFGALPTRAEEMAHLPVRIERLKSMLKWQPQTTIAHGIADTAKYV